MKKINYLDSIIRPIITEKATIFQNKIKLFLKFIKKQIKKILKKILKNYLK